MRCSNPNAALEQRIIGGDVDRTGDYTELGIERANRPDVMTAGVVKFWQKDFDDRPNHRLCCLGRSRS